MRLVVDMNVLFSVFKRDSATRKLITSSDIKLYTPSLCIKELIRNRDEICSKSKISEPEFREILKDLDLLVEVVNEETFADFGPDAVKILSSHIKDVPYAALSLSLKNSGLPIGLWSNENRLKVLERYGIKVYKTKRLLELFGLI